MTWWLKNGDYPYFDLGHTAAASVSDDGWQIVDGHYPFMQSFTSMPDSSIKMPYPIILWRISDSSPGYPYISDEPYPEVTPVPQSEYISIYDMRTAQEDFDTNGLRILSPTSCKVTEEFGGTYEVVMEHPIDDEGAWKQVLELNVLKAMGQLFPLYRVASSFSGESGKITAYGRHISYQLNDLWIHEATIDAPTGQHAIDQILGASDDKGGAEWTNCKFTGYSDIMEPYSAELSEVTPIAALIGTDSTSIVNQLGGELYRDNFYFSICKKMEGSEENAFQIRVGLNLTGIERDVDYTDFCTYLTSYDNYGQAFAVSYVPMVRFAHHVVRTMTFKYDEPDFDRLARDTMQHFGTVCNPKITYKITVADLRNNPDYAQFDNLNRYKVGDTGWIYDERLGMATNQRVLRTVKDAITGETLEITFGNLEASLTRPANLQNVIATRADRFVIRQQTAAEAKAIRTWDDLEEYTWDQARKFTWNQVEKEV